MSEHLERDRQEQSNRNRDLALRALSVVDPDRAASLMRVWAPEDPDAEEKFVAQETKAKAKVEEIRSSETGTAGRDEETAALIRRTLDLDEDEDEEEEDGGQRTGNSPPDAGNEVQPG